MADLLQAFSLGSAAILTNACMLPLYPGLLAFMAGTAGQDRGRRATALLGICVLAGILSVMLVIGLALFLLQTTFGEVLVALLPLVYGAVIVLGLLLLFDRNPFARLSVGTSPTLRNPYVTAFLYGLLLGPMTLPCTGPILTSAFLLGAGDARQLVDSLLFFLFFGLGFGWPLIVLPLLAAPFQRQITRWLAAHHTLLNRASGLLLIAVGVFGIVTELLPQWLPTLEISPPFWALYWLSVAALIALVIVAGLRRSDEQQDKRV
jgi:cytochrome c-type biogenesis protein